MPVKTKKKLTLRVESELIDQAKAYAAEHDTSVSKLVEEFFRNLRAEDDEGSHTPLVRALTGILPPDVDAKQEHHDYLLEKYG